jgi:hypothetical protein
MVSETKREFAEKKQVAHSKMSLTISHSSTFQNNVDTDWIGTSLPSVLLNHEERVLIDDDARCRHGNEESVPLHGLSKFRNPQLHVSRAT